MYCYVCKEANPTLSHHVFPKDPARRGVWLNAVGLKDDDILKGTRICSKHFEPSCFVIINSVTGKLILEKGSVPSLMIPNRKKQVKRNLQFNDEEVVENKICSQGNASDKTSDSTLPSCSHSATSTSKVKIQKRWRPAHPSQVDMVNGFSTPRRAKRHFLMAMTKVDALKKKVNHLNRSNAKLLKRIGVLEDLLEQLEQKKLITDETKANLMV